ncbi:MAG: hypothetical protein O3B22_11770 [Proteobacteria bacterium]|nr:hypothetical protein [Pseudomonadota bacterium]
MADRAPPLPVLGLVADAFTTVSANLPALQRLGRGPFVVALVLGLAFGAMQPFPWAPMAGLAMGVGYAWFSFGVFRLVLLGPDRAVLPAAPDRGVDGPLIRRSNLGTFMLRALGLAVLMALGIGAVMMVVVYPLAVLPMAPAEQQAMLTRPGLFIAGSLILSTVLAALPVGIPVVRLATVLPMTAIERDTTLAAAWALSRGHGLRLTLALLVLAAPFLLGYAALEATLAMLAGMAGADGPGFLAHLMALALATAMGMTLTALISVAMARAWTVMAP